MVLVPMPRRDCLIALLTLPNMDGCHLRQRYLARKIGSLSGYTTTSSQFLGYAYIPKYLLLRSLKLS